MVDYNLLICCIKKYWAVSILTIELDTALLSNSNYFYSKPPPNEPS